MYFTNYLNQCKIFTMLKTCQYNIFSEICEKWGRGKFISISINILIQFVLFSPIKITEFT